MVLRGMDFWSWAMSVGLVSSRSASSGVLIDEGFALLVDFLFEFSILLRFGF